jgi:hypothetical protein
VSDGGGKGVSVGGASGVSVGKGTGVSVGTGTGVLLGTGTGVLLGAGTGVFVGAGTGVLLGCWGTRVRDGAGVEVGIVTMKIGVKVNVGGTRVGGINWKGVGCKGSMGVLDTMGAMVG